MRVETLHVIEFSGNRENFSYL